jgi:hypothetical protein
MFGVHRVSYHEACRDGTCSDTIMLHWVRCIVEEASGVVEAFDDLDSASTNVADLNHAILTIWSHFLRRNTLHTVINILGDGLAAYNDLQNARQGSRSEPKRCP